MSTTKSYVKLEEEKAQHVETVYKRKRVESRQLIREQSDERATGRMYQPSARGEIGRSRGQIRPKKSHSTDNIAPYTLKFSHLELINQLRTKEGVNWPRKPQGDASG